MRIERPIARFGTKAPSPALGEFRFVTIKQLTHVLAKELLGGPGQKEINIEKLIPELLDQDTLNRFGHYFKHQTYRRPDIDEEHFWLRTKKFRDCQPPYKPFLLIKFNSEGNVLGIDFSLDLATTTYVLTRFPEIKLFREALDYLGNPCLTKSRLFSLTKQLETTESLRQAVDQMPLTPKTTCQRKMVACPPLDQVASVYVGGYGFASARGYKRYLATWGLGHCIALLLTDQAKKVSCLVHFYSNTNVSESFNLILSRFGQAKLFARIIGGSSFTNKQKFWEIYQGIPKRTEIIEEDILGNTTRNILYDTWEDELYNIEGNYFSQETPPDQETIVYIRSRIRRLFAQAFDNKSRRLLLDAAPESSWFS